MVAMSAILSAYIGVSCRQIWNTRFAFSFRYKWYKNLCHVHFPLRVFYSVWMEIPKENQNTLCEREREKEREIRFGNVIVIYFRLFPVGSRFIIVQMEYFGRNIASLKGSYEYWKHFNCLCKNSYRSNRMAFRHNLAAT